MDEKSLVLFFSWSGNTRRIAHFIGETLSADVRELQLETPYPSDYGAVLKQAKQEIQERRYPILRPLSMEWANYGTIFLGTPNWFSTMAPPVASFLRETMPTEKVIVPFCTHGGGGAGNIAHDMKEYCIGCDVLPILSICGDGGGNAKDDVEKWLNQMRSIIQFQKESKPVF